MSPGSQDDARRPLEVVAQRGKVRRVVFEDPSHALHVAPAHGHRGPGLAHHEEHPGHGDGAEPLRNDAAGQLRRRGGVQDAPAGSGVTRDAELGERVDEHHGEGHFQAYEGYGRRADRAGTAHDKSAQGNGTGASAPSSIHAIRDEVDRLGLRGEAGRSTLATATPRGVRSSSSVLYRTERGAVGETRVVDGDRTRRSLYLTRRDEEGRERSEPFDSRVVDPLIRGVKLEEEVVQKEITTEYVEEPAQAEEEAQALEADGATSNGAAALDGTDYRRVVPDLSQRAPATIVPEQVIPGPARAGGDEDAWEPEAEPAARRLPSRQAAPARTQAQSVPSGGALAATSGFTGSEGRGAYTDYDGDNHDVIDIEGIGQVLAERLHRIGIVSTHRLAYEDAELLARRLEVSPKTVRTWQAQAQLLKVKGIGPQYAEALARAGIGGIDELKHEKAEAIAARVTAYLEGLETHVLGTSVTPARVKNWQKAAKSMRKRKLPEPALGSL